MTDLKKLARESEEMGARKAAIAIYSVIQDKMRDEGKHALEVELNFVEIEMAVQEVIREIHNSMEHEDADRTP